MAFIDPNLTNQALAKTGSSFTVPGAAPPAAPAVQVDTAPAPVAPAPVAQATDSEVPEVKADTAPSGGADVKGWGQQATDATNAMANAAPKADGLQKLGALFGTALSVFTGNVGGAAAGLSTMKEQRK